MSEDKIEINSRDSSVDIQNEGNVKIQGEDNKIEIGGGKKNIVVKGKENIIRIKEKTDLISGFLKEKKWFVFLGLLLVILLLGIWIRTFNIPLLVDSTTGKNIPLALDPYYFLRMAETMIAEGKVPEIDSMRYPSANVPFTTGITADSVVWIYRIINTFKDVSVQYADIISPIVFFAFALVVFFFLIYLLTESKITALLGSWFLTIIPTYLYRTLAGFADHEAIGMFGFFSAMLVFTIGLRFLGKKSEISEDKKYKNKRNMKMALIALGTGFFTAFTIAAWGGIAKFIFIIFPVSFFLIWISNIKNNRKMEDYLVFYLIWYASSFLFVIIFGYSLFSAINAYSLNTLGLAGLFVLGFIIIDYFLIHFNEKIKFDFYKKEYRILYSLGTALVCGMIFLILFKGGFSVISEILSRFLHPFGDSRTGSTVAENQMPYLTNWMNQTGKIFFWIFYLGIITLGINLSKGLKKSKDEILFSLIWIVMISGVLFSRISASSMFNGTNAISQFIYFGSLLLFGIYLIWIYFKKEISIKNEMILITVWMFVMLISTRGAVRFFFITTPVVCFIASYSVVNIFKYLKKTKDELLKMFLLIGSVIIIICLILSSFNFVNSTVYQAKYTSPSADIQWQKAMEWVRKNTPEGSVFVHWWDYGYWVQYLGERPTVTDGGHAIGYWDHLTGRYLLTTPAPETALSFMKSHNVSYLLIDPTDLGKYAAYSKIGSDGKDNDYDRFSSVPTGVYDPSQMYETADEIRRIYTFGSGVDEDIIYKDSGKEIFIPGPTYDERGNPNYKAALGGVIFTTKSDSSVKQPEGVYFYNGEQYTIPIRYLYIKGRFIDFNTGLDAVVSVIPRMKQGENGMEIDELGAMIYLSPKTSKSLFAQLYLLDDVLNKYKTLELAYAEENPLIKQLKAQNDIQVEEFLYYQGLRGPIKIWKVDYPENIIAREEFLRTSGEYAEFDDLQFIKE